MGAASPPRTIGQYTVHGEIASGGMATVHLARLVGPSGFGRIVAVKRLHPELARNPELATRLMDEARMCARIAHPNVVPTLDVIAEDGELLLVLEYVAGESLFGALAASRERGTPVPPAIAATIARDALEGLHAAHEARDEEGAPLELVHRDLSPHNVLVDESGLSRVIDFGIAKARGRVHVSAVAGPKGKVGYMAPEQVHGKTSRQSDIFAVGVVLWEMLVGERLFQGDGDAATLARVLRARVERPSARGVDVPPELEQVLMKSLHRDPDARFENAHEMARGLEASIPGATRSEIAAWLEGLVGKRLEERREAVRQVEAHRPPGQGGGAITDGRRASSRTAPAPRRRVAAAGALVVVGGLGLAWLTSGTNARHRGAAASASSVDAVDDAIPPAFASGGDRGTATAIPPPSAESVASASSVADGRARAVAGQRPQRRVGAAPTEAGSARRLECEPPYTLDSAGRMVWKRGCF